MPSEEVTPPVTKINFAADALGEGLERSGMTGVKSTVPKVGGGGKYAGGQSGWFPVAAPVPS